MDIETQISGQFCFGDACHSFPDVRKLKALGWEAVIPLEEIVDEYIAWAQAQPGFRDYYTEAEARMEAVRTIRRVTR